MPPAHPFSLIEIPLQSKNDPRLEIRPSPIHGNGIFTTAEICKDEVIIVWGGTLFTLEEIQAGEALEHSYCMICEDIYLGHTAEHGNSVDDYINHSCDPNVWMLNEVTLAACRNICAGEEITADLAMWWEPDDESVPPWECRCGSPQCRQIFSSRDWRRPELYCRYGDHFLPYINRRIKDLQAMTQAEIKIIIPPADAGPKLLEMARTVELFFPADFDVIQELWDEFAAKGDTASHYHFLIAQQADDLLGFACYGRRPLTESTFDLYWIGVAQQQQGRGIGKALAQAVEVGVQAQGGRLLIAETEGKPSFEPTRRFYLSAGYEIEARIRDFYRPGEDLFIFTKRF